MLIRDVMTQAVVTAAPATAVREVAEIMRERNVGAVVLVAADGAPVGLITDRDLAVGVVAEGRDLSAPAEAHASSPVVTGEPAMALSDAAELMARFGIRRLPVLDGGRLAGIVTLDDIAVRTADAELQASLTQTITRGALPGFYFHHRGG
ncbi:MAG: CBS domain-containing protein [Solirubrobacteraceae bacterium]|nr:CBS domain-containing protein [Solirubrobacteraceae bacterium]MCU0313173.1 CBS domain-containing protein [Solirubrobacteraceae bacterium]